MRWLEVRRHSLTKKGEGRGRGTDLSREGVMLARSLADEVGPVAYVATSTVPRAIETAVAMGHAVDDTFDFEYPYIEGEMARHEQWEWDEPYVRYRELIDRGAGIARVAMAQLDLFRAAVERVDDREAALVVSHGGCIEPALVAAIPGADHGAWGKAIAHCEGARLAYDGGFELVTMRRR